MRGSSFPYLSSSLPIRFITKKYWIVLKKKLTHYLIAATISREEVLNSTFNQMASSSSIPVNNLDESIGTATPATVESITTVTVTAGYASIRSCSR
ncbi:hypothetical protein C5167_049735 [Papaver somniferum]|uniref:Uncharacterized protein n=1 Tax=Papaver somniferum TaxID=3469 RepID=A0A4Y7KN28_PAPSO|nr:hypothetical protein C5167_049735 [Papaver somniferum]